MDDYERLGGYETEVKIEKVCNGMGIGAEMRRSPFNRLSGGEKTRVNLARVLLMDCGALLLDEPTNHLDISSLEWLEKFLADFSGTVVVISHDRLFLDRVVKRIIEIEDGAAHFYGGDYTWYAEERRRRRAAQTDRYLRQQKEIKRIEDRAKWFVDNNRFTTKHHAILSRIDHMEKIDRPPPDRKLNAAFTGSYAPKVIASLADVGKSYGTNRIMQNVSVSITKGERIALYGANGCGKTTLLKLIAGEETECEGEIKLAASVKPAYMPQIISFNDEGATVQEILRAATGCDAGRARGVLAGFHFYAEDVHKKAGALSGGEKSRLTLCVLMQRKTNLLLLDEPTNHLDVASREWIEESLADFDGTMLFVSHDRYFLSKFANRVWSMENGRITKHDYGFEEYSATIKSSP